MNRALYSDINETVQKTLREEPGGYHFPPECELGDGEQVCSSSGKPWTYAEWLLTAKPGIFGFLPGYSAY